MDTFRNIMVALDFSESDKSVIQYAKYLAGINGVQRMDFVHVVPDVAVFSSWFFKDKKPVVDFTDTRKALVEVMRKEVEEVFGGFEARMYFEVLEGKRLDVLLQYAEENYFDVAVFGRKSAKEGSGILSRNLIRRLSSAALVVPAVTVPEGEEVVVASVQAEVLAAGNYGMTTVEKNRVVYTKEGDYAIKNIVVPVDFSFNSAKALITALALQDQVGEEATVKCLHVYNTPDLSSYKIGMTQAQFSDMIKENKREAFEEFITKYIPNSSNDLDIEIIESHQPNAGSHIFDYAKDHKADMVVIGAKGHSKIERFLMGSVTEKLLMQNEEIPTLIVK